MMTWVRAARVLSLTNKTIQIISVFDKTNPFLPTFSMHLYGPWRLGCKHTQNSCKVIFVLKGEFNSVCLLGFIAISRDFIGNEAEREARTFENREVCEYFILFLDDILRFFFKIRFSFFCNELTECNSYN